MPDTQQANGLLTDRRIHFGRLPVSVELSPAAIERTCALLHVVYAHTKNPHALDAVSKESTTAYLTRHHAEAMRYLRAVLCKNDRLIVGQDVDGVMAKYTIQAKGDPSPLVVLVNPTRKAEECLSVQMPNGVYAEVDLSTITVVSR